MEWGIPKETGILDVRRTIHLKIWPVYLSFQSKSLKYKLCLYRNSPNSIQKFTNADKDMILYVIPEDEWELWRITGISKANNLRCLWSPWFTRCATAIFKTCNTWPLSLRWQVKKLTTANTIAMWCEWIKVIPIFLSAQQKICFLVCCRISVISLCAVIWKSLEITATLLIPALSGALTLPLLSDTRALSLWFFSAQPNLSSSFLSLSLHFTLAFLLHLSVSLAASE